MRESHHAHGKCCQLMLNLCYKIRNDSCNKLFNKEHFLRTVYVTVFLYTTRLIRDTHDKTF